MAVPLGTYTPETPSGSARHRGSAPHRPTLRAIPDSDLHPRPTLPHFAHTDVEGAIQPCHAVEVEHCRQCLSSSAVPQPVPPLQLRASVVPWGDVPAHSTCRPPPAVQQEAGQQDSRTADQQAPPIARDSGRGREPLGSWAHFSTSVSPARPRRTGGGGIQNAKRKKSGAQRMGQRTGGWIRWISGWTSGWNSGGTVDVRRNAEEHGARRTSSAYLRSYRSAPDAAEQAAACFSPLGFMHLRRSPLAHPTDIRTLKRQTPLRQLRPGYHFRADLGSQLLKFRRVSWCLRACAQIMSQMTTRHRCAVAARYACPHRSALGTIRWRRWARGCARSARLVWGATHLAPGGGG